MQDLLFSKFLELGVDLYMKLMDDSTLLHQVTKNYHVLRKLIEEGLSVNATDAYGRNPLFYAVTYHNVKSVKLLIEVRLR